MPDIKDPREFFARHHQAYVTSPRHARGQDLDLLVAALSPHEGQTALDVATGGGHTAIRLAEHGVQVTVADITQAMLEDAVRLALDRGLTLTPVEAYAESLPFADEVFDIVTCRRAAHHFRDTEAFLREAHRVLKPGGRLGISDMTGSAAGVTWLDQLEQRRDPSHHHAFSPDEWYHATVSAGFGQITVQLSEEALGFEEWLAPVTPDSPDGARALEFLHRPDAPQEFVRGMTFIKRRILVWAERP